MVRQRPGVRIGCALQSGFRTADSHHQHEDGPAVEHLPHWGDDPLTTVVLEIAGVHWASEKAAVDASLAPSGSRCCSSRPAGLRPLPAPPEKARLHGRRHSPARDAAAIARHYDVSKVFYRIVLGPSMTYSCAMWPATTAGLEKTQAAKYEQVCRKLGLGPGMRLLDVGCGWGAWSFTPPVTTACAPSGSP